MELRHIRYFVAVAEERNFTRAAARLGIGQPPLSQQIKDLEAELGCALFRRTPQGADPTAAGEAFLAEARGILAAADRAATTARKAARGEQGRLRLGFTGSAPYNPLVTRVVRAFRQAYAAVPVEMREANTAVLLDLLHDGVIDAAFLRPGPADRHRPQLLSIDDEPLVAVLPASHRCAAAAQVDLGVLAPEPLILFPRAMGPNLHDLVVAACRDAGFDPAFGQEAPQIGSVVSFVAAGFGVSVVPAPIRQIRVESVGYVPLGDGVPRANLSLGWRRDERSPVVLNFVAAARRCLSERPPGA